MRECSHWLLVVGYTMTDSSHMVKRQCAFHISQHFCRQVSFPLCYYFWPKCYEIYICQGMLVSLGAMVGTSMLCQSIPYTEGFGAKQVAWMLHSGVVGAVIAPLCVLGGPLLTRAALYTAGVVGGRVFSVKSCVFATTFRP